MSAVTLNPATNLFELSPSATVSSFLASLSTPLSTADLKAVGDLARNSELRQALVDDAADLFLRLDQCAAVSSLWARAVANLAFDAAPVALACVARRFDSRIRAALLSQARTKQTGDDDDADDDDESVALIRSSVGALTNIVAGIDDAAIDALFDAELAQFLADRVFAPLSTASLDDVDHATVALALQLCHNALGSGDAVRQRLREQSLLDAIVALSKRLLGNAQLVADDELGSWYAKLFALLGELVESPAFVDVLVELSEPLARAASLPPASLLATEQNDDDPRFLAASLLMTGASHSQAHREALFRASGWKAVAFQLLGSETVLHRKVRPSLVKALAELSLADSLADELLDGGDLMRLVDIALESAVPDVRVSAAIAVGNVARTDARAQRLLVEFGAVDRLIGLVNAKRDVAPDMRVPHAAVGALSNLAVSPANKLRLGQHATLFACLKQWLEIPNALVQFAVVLLLRSLAGERQSRAQMLQHELLEALSTVASAAGYVQDDSAGTMTVEGEAEPRHFNDDEANDGKVRDMRVQYECARVLARLCAPAALNDGDAAARVVGAADVARVGAAKHFGMLAQTDLVPLQAEGLVALRDLLAVDASLLPLAQAAARRVLDSDPVARVEATPESAAPSPQHRQAEQRLARVAAQTAGELLAATSREA
jgi:hypothetical protein